MHAVPFFYCDHLDRDDHPDYCDAYISNATWRLSGCELTEAELERIDPAEAGELILLKAVGA